MVVIPFEWYVCVTTFDKTRQRESVESHLDKTHRIGCHGNMYKHLKSQGQGLINIFHTQ